MNYQLDGQCVSLCQFQPGSSGDCYSSM